MFKDKLFFFGAQEWVNFFQVQTQVLTVPTELMRQGNFSELLDPNNGYFSGARVITNPADGTAVPGQHHPSRAAVGNRHGVSARLPSPTPGYREGANNAIITSPNPQDQRKDNIRFDYRLNDRNQFTYRFSRYNWVAVDAFRGGMTFARTDWERPNRTMTASWTTQLSSTLINEATYTLLERRRVHQRLHGGRAYQRSKYGIDYPVRVPGEGDLRQGADRLDQRLPGDRRRPVSGVLVAVRSTRCRTRPPGSRGATRSRAASPSSTPARTISTRSTSTPRRAARTTRTAGSSSATRAPGGTGLSVANAAMGLFTNYAELGQRNFTKWRSLATDVFVQDSWKPTQPR